MVSQVKTLGAKPGDLSSIPRTHIAGEDGHLKIVL